MTHEESLTYCSLQNVEKSFAKSGVSIGPVSLDIKRGEVVGIRGINGAGKSTLFRMIAGILKPDKGNIIYNPEVEKHIAYVPQELSLYEALSCKDNLIFWGSVAGLNKEQVMIRSEWLMKELNLTFWSDQQVSECSGGTKRRLHLATALMRLPKVLLLDEPSVGADDESADLILHNIKHLKSLGISTLIISHRKGELEQICDRILTLHEGHLT